MHSECKQTEFALLLNTEMEKVVILSYTEYCLQVRLEAVIRMRRDAMLTKFHISALLKFET